MFKDSKLITLLRTFSKQEIKDFEKFTGSAYFKEDRNLIPLLIAIKKFHPEFRSDELTNEGLYKSIYPDENYNLPKLRILISDLYKTAENFLVYNRLKMNESERTKYLAYELKERGRRKTFL